MKAPPFGSVHYGLVANEMKAPPFGSVHEGWCRLRIPQSRSRTASGGSYSNLFDLYLNGTMVNASSSGFKFTGTGTSASDNYDAEFSSIVGNYGGTLHYTAGAATQEDIAELPEPTALALLALGVVGLALRRKVA